MTAFQTFFVFCLPACVWVWKPIATFIKKANQYKHVTDIPSKEKNLMMNEVCLN